MKALDQFKAENSAWLEAIIANYVNEMYYVEGMEAHPSDYFTDTAYITNEQCRDKELLIEIQNYIESEIINRLKRLHNINK